MDTLDRLRQLLNERNWTEYRLAKEGNLSMSTIKNSNFPHAFLTENLTIPWPNGFGIVRMRDEKRH